MLEEICRVFTFLCPVSIVEPTRAALGLMLVLAVPSLSVLKGWRGSKQ